MMLVIQKFAGDGRQNAQLTLHCLLLLVWNLQVFYVLQVWSIILVRYSSIHHCSIIDADPDS